MCFRSTWSFVSLLLHLLSVRRRRLEPGERFLLLFALANAGGVIAYTPFLTLFLPARLTVLADGNHIRWLAEATLAGAIAASVGNLLFGWASDVWGSRKRWAAAGLVLTIGSYALLARATSETGIVASIVIYQLSLNMLLGPMFAWAADVVPDSRKGLLGGLIAAGQPLGALSGVIVTLPGLGHWASMAGVAAMTTLLILPLLAQRGTAPAPVPAAPPIQQRPRLRLDFALAWLARLLMQVSGNAMFAFLLYYFYSQPSPPSQAQVASISAVALTVAFPVSLVAGRISDRLGPRRPFLMLSSMIAAIGLGIMSVAASTAAAIGGYLLFSSAAAVFSSLHSGFSMQLLPSPCRRGRDMGLLNLANTLPAIAAPLLTVAIVPAQGFTGLLWILSALALASAVAILLIRNDHQSVADGAAA